MNGLTAFHALVAMIGLFSPQQRHNKVICVKSQRLSLSKFVLQVNLALFGSFNLFALFSTAFISVAWLLSREHEVDSTLSTTWPYLCTISD